VSSDAGVFFMGNRLFSETDLSKKPCFSYGNNYLYVVHLRKTCPGDLIGQCGFCTAYILTVIINQSAMLKITRFLTRCAWALVFLPMLSYGQDPSFSVYVDNTTYTGSSVFEFDVMVKASGATSTFSLRTVQAGIWVNPTWIGGGTVTAASLVGYTQLTVPGYNGAIQWNATNSFLNCAVNVGVRPSLGSCISTSVNTTAIKVMHIRLTNTIPYACNQTPDLKFNYVANANPLRLRTSVSWRATGCSVNYDMFYPNRVYTGSAVFNGETYTTSDADGRSPVMAGKNPPGSCYTLLQLTAYLKGYYTGSHTMDAVLNVEGLNVPTTITDSIDVQLYAAAKPDSMAGSYRAALQTNGIASCVFAPGVSGHSYYIAVKHRNALETWSAAPVAFTGNTTYNFSTANTQAYQDVNNTFPQQYLVEPGVWALYNTDVNQDGSVDGFDFAAIEGDVNDFAYGYYPTDVTHPETGIDGFDFAQMEEDVSFFLYVARPF